MNLTNDYQRRMASLARAEAGRFGVSPRSFASVALARRLSQDCPDHPGAVDTIAASAPAPSPWLLRA